MGFNYKPGIDWIQDEDENDESEAPLEISSPIMHSVAAATTQSNNKQNTKAKKDWHKTCKIFLFLFFLKTCKECFNKRCFPYSV